MTPPNSARWPTRVCLRGLLWLAALPLMASVADAPACGPALPASVGARGTPARAQAVGVPQDGFPSWKERLNLVYINRARADPQTELADCDACAEKACYDPVAPLAWVYELNRAARFHSGNLSRTGSRLQHDSPCTLVDDISDLYDPNGACLGETECSCVDGVAECRDTCQRFSVRCALFGASARRENAASGGDPLSVHRMWIFERDGSEECGWRMSNGHRFNLLADDISGVGIGADGRWTQDFGYGSNDGPLYVGAHTPQSGGASTAFDFYAHYYSAGEPGRHLVNIDGECHPMAAERSGVISGGYTATYQHQQTISGGGCHRYYFVFDDEAGALFYLPSEGAYEVGEGGCADWVAQRPAMGAGCGPCQPDCAGRVCGDDGCGGGCGLCGADHSCVDGQCQLEASDAGATADAASADLGGGAPDLGAQDLAAGEAGAADSSPVFAEDGGASGGLLADAGRPTQALGAGCSCALVRTHP